MHVRLRLAPDNDNGAVMLSPRLYRSVITRGLDWLTLRDLSVLGRERIAALVLYPVTAQA